MIVSPSRRWSSVLLLIAACAGTVASADPRPRPRLAVAISVDQLRYDYLPRFRPYFGEGGFERLLAAGTNFENCTYSYAATKTAVGHATMLSGSLPCVHGIIGNEWLDPDTLLSGVAVEDQQAPLVGLAPTTMRVPGGSFDPRAGRSPRRFLASTVGDQLKATYGPRARVFGVSNKDRSAILMAGARADGAYWDEGGRVVTSTYYRATLPAWVDEFNARKIVESYFGRTWDRLCEPGVYDAVQGPDDAPGELIGDGLDRTFPHVIDGGLRAPGGAFYGIFDSSPYASEFLEAFAREVVLHEDLGTDDIPDLLCVSFSQIDSLGHNFGPDSHEIMDAMLRLDAVLARFLAFLDEHVGRDRYVVVVTADHGVAPLPENSADAHPDLPFLRVRGAELDARLTHALDTAFGPLPEGELWFARDNQGYHVRTSALAAKQLDDAAVALALRDALRRDPIVHAAFTRDEILAAPTEGEALTTLVRRSYHPARGQDVVYVLRPFVVEKAEFGTNHGTVWRYDRHVPQLWYGAGVPAASRTEPVHVSDIAPTLAGLLGIAPPPESTGGPVF